MQYVEVFGYYHEVPEPEYSEVWESFEIIWEVTIYGKEPEYNLITCEGKKYLIDKKLGVLIPFVDVDKLIMGGN